MGEGHNFQQLRAAILAMSQATDWEVARIRKDITKSLNADAFAFFNERSLLTSWEYRFLQDTMSKRQLSPAQRGARQRINEKVLSAIGKRGFRGPD
jgi:hypothetical protein